MFSEGYLFYPHRDEGDGIRSLRVSSIRHKNYDGPDIETRSRHRI